MLIIYGKTTFLKSQFTLAKARQENPKITEREYLELVKGKPAPVQKKSPVKKEVKKEDKKEGDK